MDQIEQPGLNFERPLSDFWHTYWRESNPPPRPMAYHLSETGHFEQTISKVATLFPLLPPSPRGSRHLLANHLFNNYLNFQLLIINSPFLFFRPGGERSNYVLYTVECFCQGATILLAAWSEGHLFPTHTHTRIYIYDGRCAIHFRLLIISCDCSITASVVF